MRLLYNSLLFFTCILLLNACGKEADEVYPDIRGQWQYTVAGGSTYYALDIQSTNASYTQNEVSASGIQIFTIANGRPRIQKNVLTIGGQPIRGQRKSKSFSILQAPEYANGRWTMVLDAGTFTK